MAYNTSGLMLLQSYGDFNEWLLRTTDTVANADAANYISDAVSTSSVMGRGMKLGDKVTVQTVTGDLLKPTTVTNSVECYVSGINTTTGAGTISQAT